MRPQTQSILVVKQIYKKINFKPKLQMPKLFRAHVTIDPLEDRRTRLAGNATYVSIKLCVLVDNRH